MVFSLRWEVFDYHILRETLMKIYFIAFLLLTALKESTPSMQHSRIRNSATIQFS